MLSLSKSFFLCVCFSFLFLDFYFFSSLLLKCEKCRRLPLVKEKGLY